MDDEDTDICSDADQNSTNAKCYDVTGNDSYSYSYMYMYM